MRCPDSGRTLRKLSSPSSTVTSMTVDVFYANCKVVVTLKFKQGLGQGLGCIAQVG